MLTAFYMVFATLLAPFESNLAVAGSMKPGLLPGDVILNTPTRSIPNRGGLIVFMHPVTEQIWIKRVMALGGDTIRVDDGVVTVNGTAATLTRQSDFVETYDYQGTVGTLPRCIEPSPRFGADCTKTQYEERFPGAAGYAVLDINESALDTVGPVSVPEGHVFVMGDNRDNSVDSRLPRAVGGPGFVPLAAIIGRPQWVLYSGKGRQYWNPVNWRAGRFLVPLR